MGMLIDDSIWSGVAEINLWSAETNYAVHECTDTQFILNYRLDFKIATRIQFNTIQGFNNSEKS